MAICCGSCFSLFTLRFARYTISSYQSIYMITATYMYTKGLNSHWYTVNISDLTAELIAYFQNRLAKDPQYTRITDKTVQWSTSSESASTLMILGLKEVVSKKTGEKIITLDTASHKSEESRERSVTNWRASFKAPAAITGSAATVNITPDNVEF
jgi:hypothetical protein